MTIENDAAKKGNRRKKDHDRNGQTKQDELTKAEALGKPKGRKSKNRRGKDDQPNQHPEEPKPDYDPGAGKKEDATVDIPSADSDTAETGDKLGSGFNWRRALDIALFIITATKAILSRLLFMMHTLLTVWRTADILGPRYWWMLLGLLALIIETVLKLVLKQGVESKWFCPSVFLYLCTVVPAIWLLELDRLSDRQRLSTSPAPNVTVTTNPSTNQTEQVGLSSIEGIEIPIAMSRDMWVLAIEQTLLFLLIIGRWMLPKGNISRDQLSQLLFVYIGIASDISEIFVLFEEQFVIDRPVLIYIILTAWTLSLMQYTLVLTATKSPKTRVTHTIDGDPEVGSDGQEKTGIVQWFCCACCETETWAIITTVLIQDGPFLCIRLYVMIASRSLTYTILFYTFKNILVLVLQVYRLVVINCDSSDDKNNEDSQKDCVNSPDQASNSGKNKKKGDDPLDPSRKGDKEDTEGNNEARERRKGKTSKKDQVE